ncbi:MAG: AAA family ATPase [Chloroflexi bacterium]|nr:AAA family ATPase [Chloroflexota bacterium]
MDTSARGALPHGRGHQAGELASRVLLPKAGRRTGGGSGSGVKSERAGEARTGSPSGTAVSGEPPGREVGHLGRIRGGDRPTTSVTPPSHAGPRSGAVQFGQAARADEGQNVTDSRLLTRVVLQNYKSIAACDVELRPLTFLVGPNGAGKSNFLDALRFVSDSLRFSLEHALRDRDGLAELRPRFAGRRSTIVWRLEFQIEPGHLGRFELELNTRSDGEELVRSESCKVCRLGVPGPPAGLRRALLDGVLQLRARSDAGGSRSERGRAPRSRWCQSPGGLETPRRQGAARETPCRGVPECDHARYPRRRRAANRREADGRIPTAPYDSGRRLVRR